MILLLAIAMRHFAARQSLWLFGHVPTPELWGCFYFTAFVLDVWDGLIVYHLVNLFQ